MLRSSAIRIIRALGIEGGYNVQFALDPKSSQYYVIEVNPRVSRSSALASKATGYPIARVAAKVAVGRRLEEIRNEITGRTFAAFEPALDYCVVKIPRWPYDKFPAGDRRLGTQMASTGEVMAIERTFEAALVKAMRSLEQQPPAAADLERPQLINEPNDRRLFALLHALRNGAEPTELARRSGIDRWFIDRLATIARLEKEGDVRELRRAGFSDAMIAGLRGDTVEKAAPTYKLVDTCAAEFEAATPYYSSCWEEETESEPVDARSALVVGSGPIRIGQGGGPHRRARGLPGPGAPLVRPRRPRDGDSSRPPRAAALHGVGDQRDASRYGSCRQIPPGGRGRGRRGHRRRHGGDPGCHEARRAGGRALG